jgi:hypothetical protein
VADVGTHADEVDVRDAGLGVRVEADEECGHTVGVFGHEARIAEVLEEQRRKQQVDRSAGHAPPVGDRTDHCGMV